MKAKILAWCILFGPLLADLLSHSPTSSSVGFAAAFDDLLTRLVSGSL